jgi:hypothetical protein
LELIIGHSIFMDTFDFPPVGLYVDGIGLERKGELHRFTPRKWAFESDLMLTSRQFDP